MKRITKRKATMKVKVKVKVKDKQHNNFFLYYNELKNTKIKENQRKDR